MAVKKTNKEQKPVEVVEVQETPVVSTNEAVEEVNFEIPVEEETTVEETSAIEVETPEVEIEEPEVKVDVEKAEVNVSNKPSGNVKIRMRTDHKCCIAMERYDLKAGKTYVVPVNVKNILNRAGLLAPL